MDYDFFEVFKINTVKGRIFSQQFPGDLNSGLIINEEAQRILNMEDPIGKQLNIINHSGRIVGVMENYHFDTIHNKIGPIIYVLAPQETEYLIIRMRPENRAATIQYVREKWNSIDPDKSFNFQFLEDMLDAKYLGDRLINKISTYAAYISLFVSCLGLLGLAAFSAQQRTKEIGIRKVLGASIVKIFFLQSIEYFKLIIIANIISWPIAYYVVQQFLQLYAYRIDPGVELFLFSALFTFFIAFLTISYQTFKAARTNPVESLKYE